MQENSNFFSRQNTIGIIMILIMGLVFSFIVSLFIPASLFRSEKKRVYIIYGTGLKKISKNLKDNGVIRNRKIFEIYVILSGKYKKLKAGEYEFFTGDSMYYITGKLVRGEVISHKIVIPEGSDIYDIAEILQQNELADKETFLNLTKDREFLKTIGINYVNAEGFLFPDTYNFIKGMSERTIIKTMYEKFIEKSGLIPDKIYNVSGMNLTGYNILKLASIIEKESKLDLERPKIASVFYNRLKSKEAYMRRLESCATVRYALQKKIGGLTYQDLKVKSDYNTYIIIGMPPTPICNPGVKSIQAALNPADTNYKYFVVRDNGEHTFSETLEEHIAAKYKNKMIRKKKK